MRLGLYLNVVVALVAAVLRVSGAPLVAKVALPGVGVLTNQGDLSAQMVEGIDRWLLRETARVSKEREQRWDRGLSDEQLGAARERLRTIIGAVDPLVPGARLQFLAGNTTNAAIFRSGGRQGVVAYHVRWPVLDGVIAEGLLLEPASAAPIASVICLPDADQSPEMLVGLAGSVPAESHFARHLAQSGWRVLVPILVSRDDAASGSERLKAFTNQSHREWIYRQAYEMGRHVIGYEVQKVLAAVSALEQLAVKPGHGVAVAGYGEGGLIALHAAALEPRIKAALVSGYFGPREELWSEPIYRNVSGFLRDFGAAELAALAQAAVIVEHSVPPKVDGPPAARPGRAGAAPGVIPIPEFAEVEAEVDRATKLREKSASRRSAKNGATAAAVELVHGSEGARVQFGSRKALALLARAMKVSENIDVQPGIPANEVVSVAELSNRQHRVVRELESFTQTLFRRSEGVRDESFWRAVSRTNEFASVTKARRERFWHDAMGKIDAPKLPPNPRARPLYEKAGWTGYEIMLDVFPDVYGWGYLLVPKDLEPGERRPVVVCQHGLEGLPEDTVTDDPKAGGFRSYQAFAARLAERGFIVYAPHNPYRGRDKFRVLQRKANPLGLSLFSFIIAQHEVTTDWLASLPFVDPQRIAFYGLSYGGKTAMRVPAVVERYCLSICSADFNEWVQKNVTTEARYSYMFTLEYEMPEWNLGHTFNYAEMAALICPRPFMVERGHDDGVAPDTWVAYEYSKVRRLYAKLGIPDRTEIEFFNGPHTINGVGTYRFLEKHLNWGERK